MLIYLIFLSNYSSHSFWNLIFPDASSFFLLLSLFSLSSWPLLLKFVAFDEKTRFMPESTEATDGKQGSRPFQICLIFLD